MREYQREFIEFIIANKVLTFGHFVLKSGRTSPFFLNAGLFSTGQAMSKLGYYYASALLDSDLEYDILFGPAYKGIPLVTTTAISLNRDFNKNINFCFNRKELKDHGEGGLIVGCPLEGKIVIIDDVITAGTAIKESFELIKKYDAQLSGVLIALDRQEKGIDTEQSAIQQISRDYQINVVSIVTLSDVVEYLKSIEFDSEVILAIDNYRQLWGSCKSTE